MSERGDESGEAAQYVWAECDERGELTNPFDVLGLDPRLGPRALTQILRQRAERALPEERRRLQGLWRQLTLRERDRIRWALRAHPRRSGDSAKGFEALREALPPFLHRGRLTALDLRVEDALVGPPSRAHDVIAARVVEPPAHFEIPDRGHGDDDP